MDGDEIAARARRCVGVRFRPQGRSCAAGLDCIGLVAAALGTTGARADYALRGGSLEELEKELRAAGLDRARSVQPGDVLVMQAGPEQLHLAVASVAGFVHAHVGLGRVVETPGTPEWSVIGVWRRALGQEE